MGDNKEYIAEKTPCLVPALAARDSVGVKRSPGWVTEWLLVVTREGWRADHSRPTLASIITLALSTRIR